jgi:hypothetical protein
MLSLVPGVEIRSLKNVSGSEWFFPPVSWPETPACGPELSR